MNRDQGLLQVEREWLDWIWRAYLMRKAGRLPVILVEQGRVYVAENPMDYWGSRRRVHMDELARMVEQAEQSLAVERKSAASERRNELAKAVYA